jgi:hypothetical protein
MHISLFVIMPLVEYVEKIKRKSRDPQHPLINLLIYLFYFLLPILGFPNPTPLNRNLVLEICKKKDYTKVGL